MNKFKIEEPLNKSYPAKEPYDIPLTGSARTFKNQIIAANEKLLSGIDPNENKTYTCSKFQKVNDFQLAYYYAEYFVGLWQHNIEDDKILSILPAFLTHLFLYGTCGIYKDSTENYIPVQVINKDNKYKANGQLEDQKYECINILNNFLGGNVATNSDSFRQSSKVKSFMANGTDITLFRWNVFGWGYFVVWKQNIENYYTLLRYLLNSYPTITKKLMYKGGNFSNSKIELENFLNPDTGYIHTNTISNDLLEKFKVLGGDQSGNLNLSGSIETIDYLKQELYTMLGIRINLNDKQERNVNSEVQYTQSYFDAKENTWKQNINIGWKYFNEKNGTDIEFDTLSISNDTNRNNQENEQDSNTVEVKNE